MSRCRCASGQGADSSRLSLGLDANGPGVVRGRFRWGRSASALGRLAAVRVQDRAGDVGGILAGEEQEGRRDLARLAGALHRRLGAEARDVLGVEGRGDERRPDRPRRDAVHPDALLDELLRERAGEGDDRALRGAVVEKLRAAAIGRHRCGVDDRGALLQMRQRRLGHEEIAEDVGSEGALDLLRRDLVDVLLRMLLGGVVDEDVEAAEAVDDLLDRLLAEAGVADVAGDGEAVAPLGLDEPLGLARVLALVQVHDGDVRALAGEQDRHGAADAGVAAGDDRDLVVEPSAAREARRVVRPRVHLGLAPGLLVLLLRRKGFLLGHGKSSAKARAVNAGFFRGVPGPPLPARGERCGGSRVRNAARAARLAGAGRRQRLVQEVVEDDGAEGRGADAVEEPPSVSLKLPAPSTRATATVMRLRGSEKSTRFSTQIRPAVAAMRPNTTIERPPSTGTGMVWISAPNFGEKPRRIAIRAAATKSRVE